MFKQFVLDSIKGVLNDIFGHKDRVEHTAILWGFGLIGTVPAIIIAVITHAFTDTNTVWIIHSWWYFVVIVMIPATIYTAYLVVNEKYQAYVKRSAEKL